MSAETPRNGHDHGMVDDDRDRDWIGEARLMCAKPRRTMKLPEYGHLEALLAELAPLQNIVALQNRALISLLLTVRRSGFVVEPQAIKEIEAQGLDILIKRAGLGAPIAVQLVRPKPVTPNPHG